VHKVLSPLCKILLQCDSMNIIIHIAQNSVLPSLMGYMTSECRNKLVNIFHTASSSASVDLH
jgi:hypothetical protein